uniref:G-protein coupled receptors family 3 profile domain-containing protein n=1 Tax=Xenopus tropicalis TaxID=8364 RepID=A0A1B8Y9R2_XENTR
MFILFLLLQLFPLASETLLPGRPECSLAAHSYRTNIQPGDLVIGAFLQLSEIFVTHKFSFSAKPTKVLCTLVTFRYYRHYLAFLFAVEEINRSSQILPNITLGYQIHDSCGAEPKALSGALDLMSGMKHKIPNFSCWRNNKMVGVLGDLATSTTFIMAQFLGIFRYPQISYGATDPIFNDRTQFPSFYRTIPDEEAEVDGIVQILKHFGWKWVGLIVSDDATGFRAWERLTYALASYNGCIAFSSVLKYNFHINSDHENNIFQEIEKTTANVIVLLVTIKYTYSLAHLFSMYKMPQKLWIASSFFPNVMAYRHEELETALNGSLSLIVQEGEIPTFEQFFYRFSPKANDELTRDTWEKLFNCFFSDSNSNLRYILGDTYKTCTGNETLNAADVSVYGNQNYRVTYRVYTAVYALARALHNLYSAQPLANHWDKLESLKNKVKPWQIPQSLCNEPCAPGSRKSKREGELSCCYDCIKCVDGEMSNITDAPGCSKCPEDRKSNLQRTDCIPKTITYISYMDSMGFGLTTITLILFFAVYAVFTIFLKYWHTPIVRANNQHLSCLILISLMLCSLCTLLFIGRPTQICCLLRQITFGIVFTISVSSVLAKTLTVIIAFNATKPGSKLKKYVGTQLAIILVIVCCLAEMGISVGWVASYPPYVEADMISEKDIIILQCNEGSVAFFFCIIGYIGTLALLSFIAAFLAKDFPDRFNEAKNITFSMLGFCSVWGAFVPAYLSTKGSRMVAVEIFAILSSSAGLLGCIFLPKCFIIFLRPEMNTKKLLS